MNARERIKIPVYARQRMAADTKIRAAKLSSPTDWHMEQIFYLQRTIGNQAVQRLLKAGVLQAKLKIGQPNDIYEYETDRVAEQVMQMRDPTIQIQPKPT